MRMIPPNGADTIQNPGSAIVLLPIDTTAPTLFRQNNISNNSSIWNRKAISKERITFKRLLISFCQISLKFSIRTR